MYNFSSNVQLDSLNDKLTLAFLSEWMCWFLNLLWICILENLTQPMYYTATKTIISLL